METSTNIGHQNNGRRQTSHIKRRHKMSLGKLVHYSVDLVLISMLLASVRRTTGLTLIYQNSDLRNYISKYLAFGEQVFDKFVSACRMSGYFSQRGLFDRDLPRDGGQ